MSIFMNFDNFDFYIKNQIQNQTQLKSSLKQSITSDLNKSQNKQIMLNSFIQTSPEKNTQKTNIQRQVF